MRMRCLMGKAATLLLKHILFPEAHAPPGCVPRGLCQCLEMTRRIYKTTILSLPQASQHAAVPCGAGTQGWVPHSCSPTDPNVLRFNTTWH